MTTALILTMAAFFLLSMGMMTGFALKLSRKNLKLAIDRNEWRDGYRAMARRANREEGLRRMFEDRADRAEEQLAEVGRKEAS